MTATEATFEQLDAQTIVQEMDAEYKYANEDIENLEWLYDFNIDELLDYLMNETHFFDNEFENNLFYHLDETRKFLKMAEMDKEEEEMLTKYLLNMV
jgi:hypothetical protein